MASGLAYSADFLKHLTGPGHPERPQRLTAIYDRLKDEGLPEQMTAISFGPADIEQIKLVHTTEYIQRVARHCRDGAAFMDSADSAICPQSYEVALLAVGAVLAATDAIMDTQLDNALCLVRPPGHHAEAGESMGFCLFNNVAIAARYLQQKHGLERILIIDWDVHHGNGTQHTFESDPGVFYASFHQSPASCYPGTGWAREKGIGPGRGTTLNIPFEPGATDDDYRTLYEEILLPAVEAFEPEFILASSGFDAHKDDPLADLCLSDGAFRFLIESTCALAQRCAERRLLVVLEGGYNLDVLAEGVTCQARTLLDAGDPPGTRTS